MRKIDKRIKAHRDVFAALAQGRMIAACDSHKTLIEQWNNVKAVRRGGERAGANRKVQLAQIKAMCHGLAIGGLDSQYHVWRGSLHQGDRRSQNRQYGVVGGPDGECPVEAGRVKRAARACNRFDLLQQGRDRRPEFQGQGCRLDSPGIADEKRIVKCCAQSG